MRDTCLYCGGPLRVLITHPHWRICVNRCERSSRFDVNENVIVIPRPTLIERGKPGWPKK